MVYKLHLEATELELSDQPMCSSNDKWLERTIQVKNDGGRSLEKHHKSAR